MDKIKTKSINVRLTPVLYWALQSEAEEEERSKGGIVRMALRDYFIRKRPTQAVHDHKI
jgi:hypothetical protein|tara:strand:+ start:231 stop:407 length:177 start_codon:yes stop_codon:yes gene_type:complete